MSAQLIPWTEDSNYLLDLLFHLSGPVMLPKQKFEEVWDYVDIVYTIRSRNTSGQEITHYQCRLKKRRMSSTRKSDAAGSITRRTGYSVRDSDLSGSDQKDKLSNRNDFARGGETQCMIMTLMKAFASKSHHTLENLLKKLLKIVLISKFSRP
jgi:hypothetical protein